MNRRTFLKYLGLSGGALAVGTNLSGVGIPLAEGGEGVTVTVWDTPATVQRGLKVFLDGEDVTYYCQIASEPEQYVQLLTRDSQGKTTGAKEIRKGKVRVDLSGVEDG